MDLRLSDCRKAAHAKAAAGSLTDDAKQCGIDWRTKEMSFLTKIEEEVRREARVEKQRQKISEAAHQKKHILLEKKLTYHLQKMRRNDLKRERLEGSIFESKGQDKSEGSVRHSHSFIKIPTKTPSTLLPLQHGVQSNTTERKVTYADSNGKKAKKSSLNYKSAHRTCPSHDSSVKQKNSYQNHCQEKVTSEELNSKIQSTVTWVVAAVTSILYPAIIRYEEMLQNVTYPIPDDSTLSSESLSFCSTCGETSVCKKSKMCPAEPCAKAADKSIELPITPLKLSSAHKEITFVGKTYHRKEKPKISEPKYNKTSEFPKVKTYKSDSYLFPLIKTHTNNFKDVTTQTDGLECPLPSSEKAKAAKEMWELRNIFLDFKYHLKQETELILKSIFHEMVSELTHAIPTLSSLAAQALVDQTGNDKGDLCSNVNISAAAAEIMENVLEKLQSAVEKKCIAVFSQENLSVHFKSDLTASGEHFISPKEKTSEASLSCALENTNDTAEDMAHMISEKLMARASSKPNELAHLEITTGPGCQQHRKDLTYMFLQRASKRKSSAEPNVANLIGKEEIQNFVSNIFSQSSLVGYIKEAISTVLGCIQIGLNNERLIANEETVTITQLLDDVLAKLHQKPVKTNVQKSRYPRLSSSSSTEDEKRLASTRVANGPRHERLFPPINVPGMVLYSEDENEEIDKIVDNVLLSSIKKVRAKLQERVPDHWLTRENAGVKYKINMNLPTKTDNRDEVAFRDWESKPDLPTFKNKDLLKGEPCLNKDILLFSQKEKHQTQKASDNVITSILAQMLQDISSGPSGHLDYKNGKEASVLTSGKPQDLSHQEQMDEMFSAAEIHRVAKDIVDAVLKILHISSIDIIEHSLSAQQTSLDSADVPSKEPLQIWLDGQREMKLLPAFDTVPIKDPWFETRDSESTFEPVVHINDKIICTIFQKLKSFICPKSQNCFKPESHAGHLTSAPDKKLSQSHLSAYVTKVVKIVLDAIQKELKCNKKNLNLRKSGPPKNFIGTGFFSDTKNELDSVVTTLNNDIMTSSLATCICEVLSGNTDKSNVLLPSDKLRSKISNETADTYQQKLLPSHCLCRQAEVPKCPRLQVLDRMGRTLYHMLCELIENHPHSPLSEEQNTEQVNENLRTTPALQSDIQLTSHTILEDIITKLCSVEMGRIFTNSELKVLSEYIDTDSLAFALLVEEVSRCCDIISSMVPTVIQPGSPEITNNKGNAPAPQTGATTKEKHPNKLEVMTSDICEMVFATLEGFANRNLEILSTIINGNKESNKMYCESESTNISANTHEKQLKSSLHVRAKQISSTILKALQTELNGNLPDLETCISKPLREKQGLKKIINLILDAVPPDVFNETEPEEKGIENYRYRPTNGNLPGRADPESYLEDPAGTEKENAEQQSPPEEEIKTDSLEQQKLDRIFLKTEVELKEPQKSPVVPIIRNILKEKISE